MRKYEMSVAAEQISQFPEAERPHLIDICIAITKFQAAAKLRIDIASITGGIGFIVGCVLFFGEGCARALGDASEYAIAILFPWFLLRIVFFTAFYAAPIALIGFAVAYTIMSYKYHNTLKMLAVEIRRKRNEDQLYRSAFNRLIENDPEARKIFTLKFGAVFNAIFYK